MSVQLLQNLKHKLEAKNDHQLSKKLKVDPAVVSRIRHGCVVGDSFLSRQVAPRI
jgi:hypothetical protein